MTTQIDQIFIPFRVYSIKCKKSSIHKINYNVVRLQKNIFLFFLKLQNKEVNEIFIRNCFVSQNKTC